VDSRPEGMGRMRELLGRRRQIKRDLDIKRAVDDHVIVSGLLQLFLDLGDGAGSLVVGEDLANRDVEHAEKALVLFF